MFIGMEAPLFFDRRLVGIFPTVSLTREGRRVETGSGTQNQPFAQCWSLFRSISLPVEFGNEAIL